MLVLAFTINPTTNQNMFFYIFHFDARHTHTHIHLYGRDYAKMILFYLQCDFLFFRARANHFIQNERNSQPAARH